MFKVPQIGIELPVSSYIRKHIRTKVNTGPDGAIAMLSANGLVGMGSLSVTANG